jgi:hypothetical protein
VSRIGTTLCLILRGDLLKPSADIEMFENTLKHGERGLGLVEGDFVAGFVDAEEADCEGVCEFLFSVGVDGCGVGELTVAVLSDFSVFRSVYDEGLVACGGELLCVSVVDLEGDGLTTEPVA